MSATLNLSVPDSVVVHFDPSKLQMNDQEFFEFCQLNPDLRIERSSKGDISVMAPTGGKAGRRNAKLIARLVVWAEQYATGQVFDSSTVFTLPNSAKRSPDVSWVSNQRWDALTPNQKEQFPPLCPDFVLELRSRTDSLAELEAKMEEYLSNGAQLGWLLDPFERKVHIYRAGTDVEILDDPETVSGESVLEGFVLEVRSLWD